MSMNNTPITQDRVIGLTAALAAKYAKPESGIPESDLAAAVLMNRREHFPTIANGTDTEHDLDIGAARIWVSDGTNERLVTFSAETIAIDGAGLDTGTVATSTWYYIWAFYNPTTDDSLYLLSASTSSPTAPSGYTFKRFLCDRIAAAVLTDGGANIRNGKFSGKQFVFSSIITEASTASPATVSTTVSVQVPAITCLHLGLLTGSVSVVSGAFWVAFRNPDDAPTGVAYGSVVDRSFATFAATLAVSSTIKYQTQVSSGTWIGVVLQTRGYEVI